MAESTPERRLIIRSRLAEGYRLSEIGLKDLQHVFTDWFPRAIYEDLTDDTASVDVVVRKDFTSGKFLFSTSFIRADGVVIKGKEYGEDRLLGKVCAYYDRKKTHYEGNKDGFDHRVAYYSARPITPTSGPK